MNHIARMVKTSNPLQVVNSMKSAELSSMAYRQLSQDASMLVNKLFSELQAIFPAWRNSFPSEDSLNQAKKSWVKGFVDAGIKSINQLKVGVKHARASTSPHWPSVGAFIDWCKPTPDDFGLPSREDAYSESIKNLGRYITAVWSHIIVQEAVRNTTTYVLKNRSERASRTEFYRIYAILVNRVVCGESLIFDVPKAIAEKPKFKRAPREVELNYIAIMKKKVGLT